jgi:hypothetical protein
MSEMAIYRLKDSATKHFKKIEVVEQVVVPEEAKKFNLRFANSDVEFIKFLAEKKGVSRNQIIDDLVKSIIKDFLNSLERDEYIMLIKVADMLNKVDTWNNLEASWISDLYPISYPYSEIDHDLHNQAPINNLEERSDRYKKMFTNIVNSKFVKDFREQKSNENSDEEK